MDIDSAACLGKVPTHREFVRCRASTPTMRTLDEWIRQGLHHARKNGRPDWEDRYDDASVQHFILGGNGTKAPNLLLGVMAPSRDERGRAYPFAVTCEVPKHAVSSLYYAYLPVQAAPFFQTADRLVRQAIQGDISYNEVVDRVQQCTVEVSIHSVVPPRHRRYLQQNDLGTFLERLFGHFADSEKYQLFSSLLERLRPLRNRGESGLDAGLQFPLLPDADQRASVVGFWLGTVLQLLDSVSVSPSLFWSSPAAPSGAGRLLMYVGAPDAQAFFDILSPPEGHGNICTLARDGERTNAEAALSIPTRYGQLLENERLRLSEFLRRL